MRRFALPAFSLLLFLALSPPCSLAADPGGSASGREPFLELRRALDLAEGYVVANRIDLSRQHLRSALLLYDEGKRRRGRYWHFQWAWTSPAMGGEYGLRVYMDGTILPERLGP